VEPKPNSGGHPQPWVARIVIGAGGIAIVALTLLIVRPWNWGDASAVDGAAQLARLDARLRELESNQSRPQLVFAAPLREDEGPTPTGATHTPRVAEISENGLVDEPKDRLAKIQARSEARAILIQETMMDEPLDRAWSSDAERQLQIAFQPLTGISTEIRCRSTICEVTAKGTEPAAAEAAVRRLATAIPWTDATTTLTFNRESLEGTMYISREGTRLPEADPSYDL